MINPTPSYSKTPPIQLHKEAILSRTESTLKLINSIALFIFDLAILPTSLFYTSLIATTEYIYSLQNKESPEETIQEDEIDLEKNNITSIQEDFLNFTSNLKTISIHLIGIFSPSFRKKVEQIFHKSVDQVSLGSPRKAFKSLCNTKITPESETIIEK